MTAEGDDGFHDRVRRLLVWSYDTLMSSFKHVCNGKIQPKEKYVLEWLVKSRRHIADTKKRNYSRGVHTQLHICKIK